MLCGMCLNGVQREITDVVFFIKCTHQVGNFVPKDVTIAQLGPFCVPQK